MINVEERLNYLDGVMAELAHAQLRSEIASKELKKNMDADNHRMKEDNRRMKEDNHRMKEDTRRMKKDNHRMKEDTHQMKEQARLTEESLRRMEEDTRRMKKAWGDLANKMGTVAEDVVAPNIPRLALEEFGFGEVEDLMVRARRASRRGEKRRAEYDVICSGPEKVIVVEVRSTPKRDHIEEVVARLAEFFDFYPEYEGRELVGMIASWSIDEKVFPAISKAGLYGIAMGDDTMEIVARPAVSA